MFIVTTFSEIFTKALDASGLTERELAKKLALTHGLPPMWKTGKRKPQLEIMDFLIGVLDLNVQDAEAFRSALLMEHTPVEVREELAALRVRLEQAEQELALFRKIHEQMRRSGVKFPKLIQDG